jgi:hypothetical protein
MLHRTFWTERRFTGMALLLGAVLFLVAAFRPITDSKGTPVYFLPPRKYLFVVFTHSTLWQWASILFIGGTIVTILGLALLTMQLRDAGDRAFSQLGLLAFALGAVLWFIDVAFRLSVDLWAAQEIARTAAIPDYYVPLTRWTHTLFNIHTTLSLAALLAYGGALLTTRVLPHWVGWLTIVYALAGSGVLAYTHDFVPLVHYLLTIVIGILLLLRRSELPARSHCEEAPPVVEPSTVPGEQA